MTVKNASQLPTIWYGLHMSPGIAEYTDHTGEPYRILIDPDTAKAMDPSFQGKPVFVRHVDKINLENLQEEADGYVVESFYNKVDGMHWAKFMVVSDAGLRAIQQGWKLSNCYIPKELGPGGKWHGSDYVKKMAKGEYEHLAIVPDPRYNESIILDSEGFKKYNEVKEAELAKLANSMEEKEMLNFFKKTKVENSADFEQVSVKLPKSGVEMSIVQIINEMDKIQNMHGYASDEHMVKVNDSEEMSVKDLVKKHNEAVSELEEMKKKNADLDSGEKQGEGDWKAADKTENDDDSEDEKKKENEEEDKKEEKKNDDDKGPEDKKKECKNCKKHNSEHFESLRNAESDAARLDVVIETSDDKLARGRQRYGSQK